MFKKVKRLLALTLVATLLLSAAVYANTPAYMYISKGGTMYKYDLTSESEAYMDALFDDFNNALDNDLPIFVEDETGALMELDPYDWVGSDENYDTWMEVAPQTTEPPYYYDVVVDPSGQPSPVPHAKVTKIDSNTPPAVVNYKVGDQLNLSGLSVVLTYADASISPKTVNLNEFEANGLSVSPIDSTQLTEVGSFPITVSHKDLSTGVEVAGYNVTVDPGEIVEDIKLTTPATKLSYIENENLDLTGIVVTLVLDTGEERTVELDGFSANGLSVEPLNGDPLTQVGTIPVTISHSDGPELSFDIVVTATPANITRVSVIDALKILVVFDKAVETLEVGDFVLKADAQETPVAAKAINKVDLLTEGNSCIILVNSPLTPGNNVSVNPSLTKKFNADLVSTAKYDSQFSVASIKTPIKATEINLTLSNAPSTALGQGNINDFSVIYYQSYPKAETYVINPTGLNNIDTSVVLTIPNMGDFGNSSGIVYVNNTSGVYDVSRPVAKNDKAIRSAADEATLTATVDFTGTATAIAKYILSADGSELELTEEDFDGASAKSLSTGFTTGDEAKNTITGLTDGSAAILYVLYSDDIAANWADSSKSDIYQYDIPASVQASATIRQPGADDSKTGTVKTTASASVFPKAFVVITEEEIDTPNIGDAMPTIADYPEGKELAANVHLEKMPGVVGKYINIFEADEAGTIGAFTSELLAMDDIGMLAAAKLDVVAGQESKPNNEIELDKGITADNYTGFVLYVDKENIEVGDFVPTDAKKATYAPGLNNKSLTIPSGLADGEYNLFMYHEDSGLVYKGANDLLVWATLPVVTIENLVRDTAESIKFDLKVNRTINATTDTAPWGVIGDIYTGSTPAGLPVGTGYQLFTAAVATSAVATKAAPSTTSYPKGDSWNLKATDNTEQWMRLIAVDKAGNTSAPFITKIPGYFEAITAGTWTATAWPGTATAGEGKIAYNGTSQIKASTESEAYTSDTPNYATVVKLLKDGALNPNDEFELKEDVNDIGRISSITKESTGVSTIDGLVASDFYTASTAIPLTNLSTDSLKLVGSVGDNYIELKTAGSAGALYDLSELTIGPTGVNAKASAANNASVKVKQGTKVQLPTAAAAAPIAITINDVDVKLQTTAATVEITYNSSGQYAVPTMATAYTFDASKAKANVPIVIEPNQIQAGNLVLTGPDPSGAPNSTLSLTGIVQGNIEIQGGRVDVSNYTKVGSSTLTLAPTATAVSSVVNAGIKDLKLETAKAGGVVSGKTEIKAAGSVAIATNSYKDLIINTDVKEITFQTGDNETVLKFGDGATVFPVTVTGLATATNAISTANATTLAEFAKLASKSGEFETPVLAANIGTPTATGSTSNPSFAKADGKITVTGTLSGSGLKSVEIPLTNLTNGNHLHVYQLSYNGQDAKANFVVSGAVSSGGTTIKVPISDSSGKKLSSTGFTDLFINVCDADGKALGAKYKITIDYSGATF